MESNPQNAYALIGIANTYDLKQELVPALQKYEEV
jgi:hypothetical protein